MKVYTELCNIIFSPGIYAEINCTDYIPKRTETVVKKHWYSKPKTLKEYWSGHINIGLNQQIWVRVRDKKFRLMFQHFEIRAPDSDIIAVFRIYPQRHTSYTNYAYRIMSRLGEFKKVDIADRDTTPADFESYYQTIDPSDY